jgi:hypothetical protein
VAQCEVILSISARNDDETIFVDTQFLESGASLKRPCTMRAQYGWPFH